jgi:predicted permease
MGAVWDDLRFAGRRLRQQPGFTAVAVLTLALGLGANIAIFTLIHAVMMRPLPVTRPAELYRLGNTNNCCVNSGLQRDYSLFSYALFKELQARLTEFSDLAAFQATTSVTAIRRPDGGPALSAPAAFVSGNYFRMLDVRPAAGRLIEPGDDVPGAPVVMVMSYQTWAEQFGGDPTLVGRSFLIYGTPVTLAGVAARGFFGETVRPNPAGFWLPLGQEGVLRGATASLIARPSSDWLYAIGRLAPGANAPAIFGRATQTLQAWLSAQPFFTERDRSQFPQQRIVVTPAAAGVQLMRGNFGQSLTLLFAMSGLVLLIAAANLANLLLSRADRAQAAIRAALGARSSRLVRQSLLEGLALALAGCAGAFAVSIVATRAIIGLAFPPDTILPVDLVPSATIVAFSVGLALVTGALFAAAPAWAMARTNPIEALRGVAREGADRSFVPRRSLVVVQVVLSLVLLAGAGLLSKSLSRLENQPLGFEANDRLVVRVDPPLLAGEPERLAAVYSAMQQRLGQVPGVRRATYSLYSPMEGNNWSSGIAIGGRPYDPENRISASWNRVGPDYFETMGTRVLRGRGISAEDTPASQHVAVVNDAFVRRFFPGGDPLGATLGIGDASHSGDYTIVGVVEDVKYSNAHRPTLPMIFFPVMQLATHSEPAQRQVQARSILIRTIELDVAPGATGLEPAIRRALAEAHPDFTVTRIIPMDVQIAGNFRNNRLLATLAGAYGLLALALASLGLYGVTAYGVSRRVHEIGVRMALGADRQRIVVSVLRGALIQAGVGLVIGVPLAFLAGGALTAQLFNVDSRDPFIIAAAAAVLLLTAAIAAVLPARRAASVDPTRALRAQ